LLFSSPTFFAFFIVYFAIHSLTPLRYRKYLIIGGSAIFYSWWKVGYFWLPFVLTATAYGGVGWMERARDDSTRRRRAGWTIAALFLPLLLFKYTNFVYREVLGPLTGWHGDLLSLTLPLGVSFITFTLTAFVVDICRRAFPGGVSVSSVLAYVLFFPHLIAGPILRPGEVVPQIDHPRRVPARRWTVFIALFTIGLVKKLVFADTIAAAVDVAYANGAGALTGPAAALAIYGFSAQIYCDFSGYTDMAIGLAALLGVRLPINFLRPYGARSIVDFWRRWHITLSSWLRDYVYVPLGGSKRGGWRETRNILTTMTLGGLWHGANWTFVVWGVLHGAAVAVAHALRRLPRSTHEMPRWLGVLVTFHFVSVGWVFFRAATVQQALGILRSAVGGGDWVHGTTTLRSNAFVALLIVGFVLLHPFDDHRRIRVAVRYIRPEIVWPVIVSLWILAITVSQGSSAKFIYFDF
jgi:alginate O-acetyltransferase complex protein AlgI